MAVDGFGFPIAIQETVSSAALAVQHAYEAHDQEFFRRRESDLAGKGWRSLSGEPVLRSSLNEIEPVAFFSGGGPGSGKTKIATSIILAQDIDPATICVIDPDRFKEVIPEYQELRDLGHPGAASIVHAESKKLSLKILRHMATTGRNFFYDSTMANSLQAMELLDYLNETGHQTVLIGVTVRPAEATRRVLLRGHATGRYVYPTTVLRGHKLFSRAFGDYLAQFDVCSLLDNNMPEGSSPERILAGGKGLPLEIDNAQAAADFYNHANLNEEATNYDEI